jgi:hypothetical protein
MRLISVIKFAGVVLVSVLFGLPPEANAGTITFDLPELTGSYVYSDLAAFGARKSASVPIGAGTLGATSARLVVSGYVSQGLVRGDGVLRSAQEATLGGAISVSYSYNSNGTFYQYAEMPQTVDGPFQREKPLDGPFGPPLLWIDLDLCPDVFSATLPGIIGPVPEGGILWSEGLEVIIPVTGTITQAYLVLEGPGLPEPATLSLLALGGLLALRRRARR